VSGTPTTLACDGELPGGISVFVQLAVSGTGGAYDFGFLFQPGDTNPLLIPSNQTAPPVPIGGSLGFTSASTGRVTIQNPNKGRSFQQFEVAPIGFRVTSVSTPDCAVTEGAGIACQGELRPRGTFVVRLDTEPVSGSPAAVLVAKGTDKGFAFVQGGDPCPDLEANVARLQAEAAVLRSHIAAMTKVRKARASLSSLRKRLAGITRQLAAQRAQLKSCGAGRERKSAAGTACDPEGKAAAQWSGRVAGLTAVLPVERRVAARVNALRAVPKRTQKALAAAKAASSRASKALSACDAALTLN
jgi:hypothetical protein